MNNTGAGFMKFCIKCDNLYKYQTVPKTDDEGKTFLTLVLECTQCSYQEQTDDTCLSYTLHTSSGHKTPINPDVVYDTTLARTRKLRCENIKCPSNDSDNPASKLNPEMVCFSYDSTEKMVYVCTLCKEYRL